MRPPPLTTLALLAFAACAPGAAPSAPASTPGPVDRLRADPGAYRVYDGAGAPASLDAIVAAAQEISVLFVGEEHDDSIGHQIEAELFAGALRRAGARPVVLSLEMFERDVQGVVDEYLGGVITEPYFLADARPWPGYRGAHRPLVELARSNGLRVLAANAPRRYVNLAARLSVDSLSRLSPDALRSLPPLPLPQPSAAYRAMFDSVMARAPHEGMPPHMFDGQRLWDAAMGNAVAGALFERPDALVVHVAGDFHVERRLGAAEALLHYRPGTRLLVVAIRSASDPGSFMPKEHVGLGDYVVLTRKP